MTSAQLQYYLFILILPAVGITFSMLTAVTILSSIISIGIAIALYVTSPEGIIPNRTVNRITGFIVNTLRSIPVIIFIILLIPVSRAITGSGIGVKAGIICLLFVIPPYTTRIFEKNLRDVDRDLIEAGKAMGLSKRHILCRVIIHDATPSIVLSIVFVAFVTLSATALLGLLGIGGIGNVAMTYGYQTFNDFVMWTCIAIIVVSILAINALGNWIHKKII